MSKSFQIDIFGEDSKIQAENDVKALKSNASRYMRHKFVLHYLAQGEVNATLAAKKAGYSEKTAKVQASQLLKDIQVRELVNQEKEKRIKKLTIDSEWWAKEVISLHEKNTGQKMKSRSLFKKNGDFDKTVYFFEDDSGAAAKSLDMLGKALAIYTETKKIEGSLNIEDLKNMSVENILE